MTQGHKGSVVPQKGGVSPIDNNTVFYAPLDCDVRDVIKGVRPLGERKCIYMNGTNEGPRIQFPIVSGKVIEGWFYIYTDQTQHTMGSRYLLDFRTGQDSSWVYTSGFGSNWSNGKIYVDGVLQAGATYASLPKDKWFHLYLENANTFTDDIVLFSRYTNNENMKGKVEEIKIWDRALSEEEIRKSSQGRIMNNNGLVGHWSSSQSEGDVLYDLVGGNDAIITQGQWIEGRSVYSLVEGSYPGGIIIEEGTTNNFPYPMTQQYAGGALSAKAAYYVIEGYRVSAIAQPLSAPLPGCKIMISSSQSFTVSGYTDLTNVKIYHKGWNTSNAQVYAQTSTAINPDSNGFFTKTIDVGTQTGLSYVNVGIGDPGLANYWIEKVQVEQKSFATSFVDGTRSNSVIEYTSSIFPQEDFTVGMWVCHTGDRRTGSPNYKLFALGEGQMTNRMTLWNYDPIGTDTRKLVLDSGSDTGTRQYKDLISSTPFQVGKWEMLTISFHHGTKTFKVYRDDNLWSSLTVASLSGIDKVIISNCGWIIDELRIDKVVRTLEEIQARYHQGRNGE